MNSYIRKSISTVLVAAILLAFTFSTASAGPKVINQTSTRETITSGAVLDRITRFTDDGWLNINVLRINLDNPYVKVDTISNSETMRKLTTTKDLAKATGAVAAVNGGFFTWAAEPGVGNPIGTVIQSGQITSTANDFNTTSESMATMSISKLNEVLYSSWKTDITLVAPNGSTIAVGRYNKPYYGHRDFTVMDRRWSQTTIGTDNGASDIVEMIVDNGKVVEIRKSQPSVPIPENGYAVITRVEGGAIIDANFKVGDQVGLSITTTPDWNNFQTAVTGGTMLLKDGKIPAAFTHIPEGTRSTRNPRTAVGSSADGKQLMLVTVDGRQNDSIGVTLTELAELMAGLGAFNALNLDGGGSTAMVARTPGTTALDVVNDPSDGSLRRISTALGVFSIAPPSELDGLIIDTADGNVFVNTSRAYTVRGYDKYFNPITVNSDQVKWSVSGIQGSFKGNVFYPTSVGSGKIKATVGGISSEIEINSLSSPVELILSDKSLKLPLNKSVKLSISGKNKNGYYAVVSPGDVTWAINGNIGRCDKGTFIASGQGAGYIDASIGSTHAYCAVSVAAESRTVADTFEAENGNFTAYPSSVSGSYSISGELAHSGSTSGKLVYDFTSSIDDTRAAYLVFANGGKPLSPNTSGIGVWVYNATPSSSWLRAEVYDTKGGKHLIDFAKGMDWTGWKYVEFSLQGVNSPAMLTKIYTVQVNPVADSGCIYLDDLTLTTSTYPPIVSNIPQNTVPVDEANKAVTYTKASDSFRFAVFGQAHEPRNILEKLIAVKLSDKTNSYLEAAAVVGSSQHAVTSLLKKPVIATNTGYKSIDMVNSRLIQLDMSKKGLRLSNPAQWHWFLQQMDSTQGSNVFIFLADSPGNFSDTLEGNLFQDVLTKYKQRTGKNVWVFYKGSKNTSYMERGIKYVVTAGYDVAGLNPKTTDQVKYVLVTVKGSTVTFEFKPVI